MSLPRSSVMLLLGLAVLAAAGAAAADPPASGRETPPAPPPREAAVPPALPPASATDAEALRKQAMALHDEAWALYEAGRYRAAIDRLEAALRIDPQGRELVFNLALLHEKLGDLKEAVGAYRRYLDMQPEPKDRARVQATLRRLEGAEREAATAPAPGRPVAIPAPPPPAAPRPVRPWVIVTGSVAGAAFLVGSAFGLAALGKNPGADARTGPGVTIADLQAAARAAHTDAVVADVSFLATAAAAGTAFFLYLTTPRRTAPAPGAVVGAAARVSLAGPLAVSF